MLDNPNVMKAFMEKLAIDLDPNINYETPTAMRQGGIPGAPASHMESKPGTYLKNETGNWTKYKKPNRFISGAKGLAKGLGKWVGIPAAILSLSGFMAATGAPRSTYGDIHR